MRILGNWLLFNDGESRPILRAKVQTGSGMMIAEQFLLDILNNFDVIVSRPNSEVLPVASLRSRHPLTRTVR